MKLSVKILLTSLLMIPALRINAESSDPASLSEAMLTFKEACLTERKALSNRNQLTMGKALKLFQKLKTAPFKYNISAESSAGVLGEPVMQFNSRYCDQLMRKSFSIVPLDTLHAMRDYNVIRAQILDGNFSLKPNSSAIISIKASGNCAMMVISEEGLPVKVSSSIDGEPLRFNSEEEGTVNWQTWTLPKVKRDMEFTIENPNDKTVSFAIAVQ